MEGVAADEVLVELDVPVVEVAGLAESAQGLENVLRFLNAFGHEHVPVLVHVDGDAVLPVGERGWSGVCAPVDRVDAGHRISGNHVPDAAEGGHGVE